MSTKYFNFNNEADLTPIEVNDETGEVQFTLDGQVATFDSVQEFAEFYALARNVVPENLKNWTLTEDGNHVAFVLRAGTAGLEADEIANIANGLRAAGMSPEEIGRAIASAQTAETRETQIAETQQSTAQIVETVVSALIEQSKKNELALIVLYGDTPISSDVSLFDPIEDDEEYYDEYGEAFNIEYTAEETCHHNLTAKIRTKFDELAVEYPNVPTLTALRIETGIDNDTESRSKLQRATIVAAIAARGVEVHVIDTTNGVVVINKFANTPEVQELLAEEDTKVSDDTNRYYIYKA